MTQRNEWKTEGGRRLRGRRTDLDLTIDEVAEAIGKSPAMVYRYESGATDPMRAGVSVIYAAALRVRSLASLYMSGRVEAL